MTESNNNVELILKSVLIGLTAFMVLANKLPDFSRVPDKILDKVLTGAGGAGAGAVGAQGFKGKDRPTGDPKNKDGGPGPDKDFKPTDEPDDDDKPDGDEAETVEQTQNKLSPIKKFAVGGIIGGGVLGLIGVLYSAFTVAPGDTVTGKIKNIFGSIENQYDKLKRQIRKLKRKIMRKPKEKYVYFDYEGIGGEGGNIKTSTKLIPKKATKIEEEDPLEPELILTHTEIETLEMRLNEISAELQNFHLKIKEGHHVKIHNIVDVFLKYINLMKELRKGNEIKYKTTLQGITQIINELFNSLANLHKTGKLKQIIELIENYDINKIKENERGQFFMLQSELKQFNVNKYLNNILQALYELQLLLNKMLRKGLQNKKIIDDFINQILGIIKITENDSISIMNALDIFQSLEKIQIKK